MEFIQTKLNEIITLLKEQSLMKKEFLTLEETACYLGQSKSNVYKLTSRKEIPYYVPSGKKIFFKRQEIDKWISDSRINSVGDVQTNLYQYLNR